MLAELGEHARLAADLGVDPISFTEHHFHVEGIVPLAANPIRVVVWTFNALIPHAKPMRSIEPCQTRVPPRLVST